MQISLLLSLKIELGFRRSTKPQPELSFAQNYG